MTHLFVTMSNRMKDLVSRCPIEEVMQVMSGRWPTLLIYYLKQGTKRFSDLRRDNPTISHKMLTLELRKLEGAGIVARTEFGGYPSRVEYDLTPAGLKLVPLLDALGSWWDATAAGRSQADASPAQATGLPGGTFSN
jgi:DNA-binding HxlR family transcriptional regulator